MIPFKEIPISVDAETQLPRRKGSCPNGRSLECVDCPVVKFVPDYTVVPSLQHIAEAESKRAFRSTLVCTGWEPQQIGYDSDNVSGFIAYFLGEHKFPFTVHEYSGQPIGIEDFLPHIQEWALRSIHNLLN